MTATARRVTAVMILCVVVIGCGFGLRQVSGLQRVPGDQVDLFGSPLDPESSQRDEHITWFLNVLNAGRSPTPAELDQRLDPSIRRDLDVTVFDSVMTALAGKAPFTFVGRSGLANGDDSVAVLSGSGEPLSLRSFMNADNGKLLGIGIYFDETLRSAPFPIERRVVVAGASFALSLAGVVRLWARRTRASWLLLGAGATCAAQFFLGVDSPAVFTIGLVAGPVAAMQATGSILLSLAIGRWRAAALVTALLAMLAAALVWTATDTAAVGLPQNLLLIGHNPALARALSNAAAALTVAASICAGVFSIRSWRDKGRADSTTGTALLQSFGLIVVAAVMGSVGVAWLSGSSSYRTQLSLAANIALLSIGAVLLAVLSVERSSELVESRAARIRLLEATDAARRQIERDLHDGTQQRLVSALISVKRTQHRFGHLDAALHNDLGTSATQLQDALDELRSLTQGLHPSMLDHGLAPALESLAERAAVPVELALDPGLTPCSIAVATAAYFVASESITNATRHAAASVVRVSTASTPGGWKLMVADDGCGGAEVKRGSGLRQLTDRVETVGGTLRIDSPPTQGTIVTASFIDPKEPDARHSR
jgi:signal transduction histidine kinase